jgi:hypothetical protein
VLALRIAPQLPYVTIGETPAPDPLPLEALVRVAAVSPNRGETTPAPGQGVRRRSARRMGPTRGGVHVLAGDEPDGLS